MCDGNDSCLLRKSQRQFPNADNQRINENGENTILKFPREISTDPGVGAKERKLAMIPCSRHIGENWQHRDFVIVVPKNERIVREQEKRKNDGERSGGKHTDPVAAREW